MIDAILKQPNRAELLRAWAALLEAPEPLDSIPAELASLTIVEVEARMVEIALRDCGTIGLACKRLGIGRSTLKRWRKRGIA